MVSTPVSAAAPATALLASSLLSDQDLSFILPLPDQSIQQAPLPPPRCLSTNIPSLSALNDRLLPGRVVTLSSATDTNSQVARLLLVDSLLQGGEAAVLDTRGEFDVVGLWELVVRRLKDEGGSHAEKETQKEVESRAKEVLGRVRIMRVFDFVGLREALGELREGLEVGVERGEVVSDEVVSPAAERSKPLMRTEIADSEDEDEEEEEEMLFDTTAPPAPALAPDTATASSAIPSHQQNPSKNTPPRQPLKLILIDNLSHVLTPLLKKDSIQANNLSTLFLTTLTNLTRTHALHTIILNPCTTPLSTGANPTRPSHNNPGDTAPPSPPPTSTTRQPPPPPPSAFSSNTALPALGALWARFADVHVLLSQLPKGRMDARVFYAEGRGGRGKRRGVQMGCVVEVLGDRYGGGVGGWGVFGEGGDDGGKGG